MNPTDLTPAELRDELDRIDRMRRPLTGATMMRRNMVRQELESRPRPLRIEEPARKMRAQLAALGGR